MWRAENKGLKQMLRKREVNRMPRRVAVIGGGASGLVAAISAAGEGASVTVYESGARVGRKILATGNGRCNMTNINASIEHYHGENPNFIRGVTERFWVEETLEFFSGLGIVPKTEDDGRVYPYSGQASAVLDVLRLRAQALGINIICSFDVETVNKKNGIFIIKAYDGRSVESDSVIIATGGKAAPDLGSKGAGYDILKSFGHTITAIRPSLVQLRTASDTAGKLKGIHVNANVKLGSYAEYGEVLFTEYGLSGIAVFSLTSRLENHKIISLDLMPEYDSARLINMLWLRVASAPETPLESYFTGMLNKRVGQIILKQAGIAPLSRKSATLGESEINRLAAIIKNWEFEITGTMSWNNAQVTKGGAATDEFEGATLMSKKVSNLYAAGEVLDIDGDCGGYNLQWAWASGYIAGKNAAREV